MTYGPKPKTIGERFALHYIPEPNSGCWLWEGATTDHGYPLLSVARSKNKLAHRVSYELHKEKIPQGMEVDHLCRVRCCVNPEHLEAVTPAENHFRARKKFCSKGHALSGDNLRVWVSPTTGYEQRLCITCRRASSERHNKLARMK